jgi:hypothetical protein
MDKSGKLKPRLGEEIMRRSSFYSTTGGAVEYRQPILKTKLKNQFWEMRTTISRRFSSFFLFPFSRHLMTWQLLISFFNLHNSVVLIEAEVGRGDNAEE